MKIVTANRLADGEVVWLGAGDRWVDQCRFARIFRDNEDITVSVARTASQAVVELYAIDVTNERGFPVPVRLRERIRASGPTVRSELGKQARDVLSARAA